MKRILISASAAGLLLTLLVGCSSPPPAAPPVAPAKGKPGAGGLAPNATEAPPGVPIGDHRGGLDGGTVPGMKTKK